jgi:hypothetical protein
MSRRS